MIRTASYTLPRDYDAGTHLNYAVVYDNCILAKKSKDSGKENGKDMVKILRLSHNIRYSSLS